MSIEENLEKISLTLEEGVTLVVVTKTYPSKIVMQAYDAGYRVFGENRPQEMVEKYNQMPKDIDWHLIGNLQTNKVKYIAPFVSMIHSVDSVKLLGYIQKEAVKNSRIIDVLFEIFIAQEESKHGWDFCDLLEFVQQGSTIEYPNIRFRGVMGMATFTNNQEQVKQEFTMLKEHFDVLKRHINTFDTISMGMSGDYQLAMQCGSNMVRVGSSIFGKR